MFELGIITLENLLAYFRNKTNVSDVNHFWLDANIAWLFMDIAKKIRSWSFTRGYAV